MSDIDRFFANVNKTSTCWLWTGKCDPEGYGLFYVHSKQVRAHRYSYELHWSVIPKSYFVRHTCDVPGCVNPKHLVFGSAKQNSEDMVNRKRSNLNKTIVHLTKDQKQSIKNLYTTTEMTVAELASMFNINRRTVSRILADDRFAHSGTDKPAEDGLKQKLIILIDELQTLIKSL